MPTAGVWNLGPLHPFSNLGLTFSWGPSFPGKMQAVFGSSYGSEHGDLRPKRVVDIGHLTWANRCFYCVCVSLPKKRIDRPVPKLSLIVQGPAFFFGGNHRKSQPFSVDFLPTQCFTASISGCRLAGRHRTSTGVTLRTNEGPGVHPEKMGR